jgi:hypothetical protein
MFNATGQKLIREKRSGTVTDQLRALTTEELLKDLHTSADQLERIETLLHQLPKDSKTAQQCKVMLRKALTTLIDEMVPRVSAHEDEYQRLTMTLLTDANRLVINVPPMHSQQKRAALLPSEPGFIRKKRKTAAPPDETSKRTRKKRTIKPQKAAARKASVAYKQSRQQQPQPLKMEEDAHLVA